MTKTRPDPDSEYLSKYLLDFNKRELDKFFHPEKFPKVLLSVAALGVVAFFFVAWMFPLKDQLLDRQFQKDPASASQEMEVQNLNILGPQSIKKGEDLTVLVTARSDLKSGSNLRLNLNYPSDYLMLLSAKPLDVMQSDSRLVNNASGEITLEYEFPKSFQTTGTQQEILALTFKPKIPGRVNITFGDSTNLFDQDKKIIELWKNNYSLLITD